MGRISTGDQRMEELIRRASAINGKISCMKEYQNCLDSINHATVNGERRNVLLGELQRENKQIQAYQEENRMLKDAVEECLDTLAVVMARHREVMKRKEVEECGPSPTTIAAILQSFGAKDSEEKEKIRKFVSSICDHMSQGEQAADVAAAKMAQLAKENAVLREILSASHSSSGQQNTYVRAMAELRQRRADGVDDGDSISSLESDEGQLNSTIIENDVC